MIGLVSTAWRTVALLLAAGVCLAGLGVVVAIGFILRKLRGLRGLPLDLLGGAGLPKTAEAWGVDPDELDELDDEREAAARLGSLGDESELPPPDWSSGP